MSDTIVTPARRRRPVEWLRDRPRAETLAWTGLIVLAIVLRFVDLGDRPFHHDESQDAYFSFNFYKDFSSYEYNPLLHGPFRFYLTGFFYWLFDPTNFTARLAPALMGVLAVALPYLLRHQLGRVGAFAAAVALAVGPTYLYFGRFAREDIYLAAVTLAMIVAAFRFLRRPHTVTLCLFAGLIAVAFAVKESGLVLAGIAGLFFLVAMVVQGVLAQRAGGKFGDGEIAGALAKVGWAGWVSALATLIFVYVLLFTQFFTNFDCTTTASSPEHPAHPTSCVNAVVYGLEYWSDQQDVARGDDPAWLYVSILFGEEWPILLLALAGAVFTFLKPTTLRVFLIVFFVGVFGFHAWGSERFAWLALHPLLPLILLAGVGVQGLWESRAVLVRRGGFALVGVGALYMVFASFTANAKYRADPRSLLVSTQSSEQVAQIAEQVNALGDVTITIDASEGATFPYAWYFRDRSQFIELGTLGAGPDQSTAPLPDTQVAVLTENAYNRLKPDLSAYDCRHFDFRVWWVKEYKKAIPFASNPKLANQDGPGFTPSAWLNWFTKREAWNPTGGMREWFCVRRDVGPLPGKGTASEIPTPAPA